MIDAIIIALDKAAKSFNNTSVSLNDFGKAIHLLGRCGVSVEEDAPKPPTRIIRFRRRLNAQGI